MAQEAGFVFVKNVFSRAKKKIFSSRSRGRIRHPVLIFSPHALWRVIGVTRMPLFMSSFSNLLQVIPAHGTRRLPEDPRLMTMTPNCYRRPWISYHPTLPSAEWSYKSPRLAPYWHPHW